MNTTKTESGKRTITIPLSLIDMLNKYKEWQDNEKIQWSEEWSNFNKLFIQENGSPIFPYSPSQWFGKFVRKNNLLPLTFHQLRHTNASLLIGQGVDIATVSKRLGHSKVSVTLDIYTHAIKKYDREAAEKLETLIGNTDN